MDLAFGLPAAGMAGFRRQGIEFFLDEPHGFVGIKLIEAILYH